MKKLVLIYTIIASLLQACNTGEHENTGRQPVLISKANAGACCVFLTKDHRDLPVISWIEQDSKKNKQFYFSSWDTVTGRFGSAITVPIEPNTSIHEEGMPKIAFKADGTIVAIYETSVPSSKSKWGLSDIQYTMSYNGGRTWTERKSIQSDPALLGSRSFADIIRLDDGEVAVSWLDTDPVRSELGRPVKFAKTSAQSGFSEAVLVDSAACQCCRTAMSTNGQGQVNVVFRDLLPGSVRDISISVSSDNGLSFGKAVPFSGDHWVVDGCPHNGPSVVFNKDTKYVTWYTGAKQGGVYYAALDGNNKTLVKRELSRAGRFVQLTMMPNGDRVAAFDVPYEEGGKIFKKIMLNKIQDKEFLEKEVSLPSSHASYPVITTLGKDQVVVAWTDDSKVYYTLEHSTAINRVVQEDAAAHSDTGETGTSAALATSKDPVCGMMVSATAESEQVVKDGQTIRFCSPACKRTFLNNAH